MKANIFYNQKLIGDVLLVLIDNEAPVTSFENLDDVTLIYSGEKLIGINIFNISDIVKFKTVGQIVLPSDTLIDIINNKISVLNIEKIDYVQSSGFTIGRIIKVEEHPESDHLHILKIDIGTKILNIVCGAVNVKENMLTVVATKGTMLMDGKVIEEGKLLGVTSEGMCCSPKILGMNIDYPEHCLIEFEEGKVSPGDDFFSLQQE